MTTSLQQITAKIGHGPWRLDEAGLGQKDLAAELCRALSGTVLTLESATAVAPNDNFVQIDAVAQRLLGVEKQPIRFLFFLSGGKLECAWIAALPVQWAFMWGYPDLPNNPDGSPSFFGQLQFGNAPRVIFSSVEKVAPDILKAWNDLDPSADKIEVRPGLSYHGLFNRNTAPAKLSSLCDLVGIKDGLPCMAALVQGKSEDRLKLSLLPSHNLADHFTTLPFKIEIAELLLSTTTSLFAPTPQSRVEFVGTLQMGTSTTKHEFAMLWPLGSNQLVLSTRRPIPFAGFPALFAKTEPNALEQLKAVEIAEADHATFEISEIVLGLSFAPPLGITTFSATLGSTPTWKASFVPQALADVLAIEGYKLRLAVIPHLELFAETWLRIGGGLVHISARIPDMVFAGELAPNEQIDVNKLFGKFLPQKDSDSFSQLSVMDLNMVADFKNGNYLFEIELQSAWEIHLGGATALPLRSVQLSLEKEATSNTVSLGCMGVVGGIPLEFQVSHSGDEAGSYWSFYGASAPGHDIPFGKLMEDVVVYFGGNHDNHKQFPSALTSFVIRDLRAQFSSGPHGAKDISFHCEGEWTVATDKGKNSVVDLSLTVTHSTVGNTPTTCFNGLLTLGDLVFSLAALGEKASDCVVATYSHVGGPRFITLGDLLGNLVDADLKALDALKLDLKNAIFAYTGGASGSKFIFGMEIGIDLDLSKLPLVGKGLSKVGKVSVDDLKVFYAQSALLVSDVSTINDLIPRTFPRLPELTKPAGKPVRELKDEQKVVALGKGLHITASLNLGLTSQPLALPTGGNATDTQSTDTQSTDTPAVPNATTTDNATWINIQKAIGPVHFERVGVEYRASKLWVLVSGSLGMAGLTISLDGLSLGAPLEKFEPSKIKASLRGLGLDYRNDFVEIGGAFMKAPPQNAGDPPEYIGAAIIKAKGLTISAFGKYTTVKDPNAGNKEETSFFIYGVLDYPIGGPAFFFVTGLAAGFGYNRNLIVPPIERLSQFSLIKAAQKDTTFTDVLNALRQDIPASPGEHFLAAGIMFTSFKLVESTVIVTVAFGKRVELHLLGLSKLRIPAAELGEGITPVAEVELAVKGTFIPADGFLELRALLTPTSYLFEKDCHLTGGFAFLCWFKPRAGAADGDFVLTLGGYHPSYHLPAHYPVVPRLGFNWQVVPDTFSLSGDVYFALTPAAVMAGGHLQGEWRSGSVHAWFRAGVDFLIAWKPYHYDATAYIDIGVEVTFEFFGTQRLSLDVGADLHIWGPKFAGDATIHLWIISFTIHFGNSEASKPKAIAWADFKTSFLPKAEELCSIAVADGLVRKGKDDDKYDLGFINGKHFCLVTDSRIPSTNAAHGGTYTGSKFGIAPVGIKEVSSSTHTITIQKSNQTDVSGQSNQTDVSGQFDYEPVKKNVPAALWGESLAPTLNGPQFVENALSGFKITAKEPKKPDQTTKIARSKLLIGQSSPRQNCHWGKEGKAFKRGDQIKKDFGAETAMQKRDALLKELGLNLDGLKLTKSLTYDFMRPPQSEAA